MQSSSGQNTHGSPLPIGYAYMHCHMEQQPQDGQVQNEYEYELLTEYIRSQATTEVGAIRYPFDVSYFSPSNQVYVSQESNQTMTRHHMTMGGSECAFQGFDMAGWSGGNDGPFAFAGQEANSATAMSVPACYDETVDHSRMSYFPPANMYPHCNDVYSEQVPSTDVAGSLGAQGSTGESGEPSLADTNSPMALYNHQTPVVLASSNPHMAETIATQQNESKIVFIAFKDFPSDSLPPKASYSRPIRFEGILTLTSPTLTGEEETGLEPWHFKNLKDSQVNHEGFAKLYFRYPWKLVGNTRSIDPTAGMRAMTDLGLWDGEDDETLRQKYTEGKVRPRYIEWVSIVEHPLFTFSERSPEGG